ncbi:MAG: helix-turn-helix domain-containing protein [Gammaproteobacteria bacterium]|nr:helix-turn-helix domain-containing protein [Gammaproteobacteria bacterium]
MPINSIYSMSDLAIAKEIGQRIEQLRLETNITQGFIANELGITTKTYRNAINGQSKFETIIGILRVLEHLDLVERFIPEMPFSPIELMKLKGKQRQRASRQNKEELAPKENNENSQW